MVALKNPFDLDTILDFFPFCAKVFFPLLDGSMTVLEDLEFEIDIDLILRVSGYSTGRNPPKKFIDTASKMTALCLKVARPKVVYEICEISGLGEDFIKINGTELKGKVLINVLKGSEKAVVFVGTLGPKLDEEIARLSSEGDILSSTVLDMIGVIALGVSSIDFYKEVLALEAESEDYGLTPSFGPGECRWDITEQKDIFDLVDAGSIGVRLNESYLMLPKKSRSGIMGIGPKELISKATPCDLCDRKDCSGRDMLEIMGSQYER
jgi:hypothetical protein